METAKSTILETASMVIESLPDELSHETISQIQVKFDDIQSGSLEHPLQSN
jgi:hypothetical protein